MSLAKSIRAFLPIVLTRFATIWITFLFVPNLHAADRPNIVIVLADDMGYGDAGCYNAASKCPTPNIDSLASAGTRFTDAHSAGSWCTPSRYGLLTGRYAFRTSLAWQKQPVIAKDVRTIGNVLQDTGYETAMVGKWHLGFEDGKKADLSQDILGGPCDRGFTTYFGLPASLDIPDYFWIVNRSVPKPPTVKIEDRNTDGWSRIQGAFWRGGLRGEDFVMEDVLDRIGEEADGRISDLSKQDRPFFLYVPLTSPHTPWLPSKKYESADQAGLYSQFVYHTDAVLGRILKSLDRNKIAENTLVIFTSDNGPVWYQRDIKRFGHDAMGGLRGMKGDVWEAGHRVPFIVRWPKHVPEGNVSTQLLGFVDVHATLAEIGGASKAESAVDSRSFAQAWQGKTQTTVRKELVCFQEPIALRSGNWKLIDRPGSSGFLSHKPGVPFKRDNKDALNPQAAKADAPSGQLYDLANDLAETKNLWNEKPEVVKELQARLAEISK